MSKIFDSIKIYGTGTTTSSTLQTFNSGGTNTFLVRDNGNVGIGTSTPTTKLDIDLGSTSGTDVAIQTRGAIPFLVNNRTFFSVNNNGRLTAGDIGGSSNLGHTFAAPIGSSNALKVTSDGSYQGLFSINTDGSFDIGNSVIAGSYFDSNGTNIFRFYGSNGGQSQKIGINEITPTATVHIKGSDSLSTNYGLKVQNSGGTDNLIVRNDGNVGIGTSSPSYQFTLKSRTSSNSNIPFRITNSGETASFQYYDNGDFWIGNSSASSAMSYISSNGSSTLTIDSNLYNGIQFTVSGSNNSYLGIVGLGTMIWRLPTNFEYRRTSDNNTFANIQNGNGDWSFHYPTNVKPSPDAKVTIYGNDNLSTGRGLTVYGFTGTTPNLIVRNDGNVGIGTSTPTRTIDSRGTFNFEYSSGTYARFDGSVMELQVGNSNNSLLLNKDNTNITELNGYSSTRVKNNLYLNSIFLESNGSYFRENTQISFRRSDNNQYGLWDSTNYRLKIGNLGLNQQLSSITSTLHVLGSDNTSSNYGLKVDNYTGGTNLIVRNDGYFNAGDGNLISYENTNDIFIGSDSNKYKNLKIGPYNTPFMFFEIAASRTTIYTDTIIGGSSVVLVGNTARVKISGDGSLGLRNIGFQYNGTNGNTDYVIGNESDNLNTTIRLSFNPTQFGYPYTATATDANNSWRVGIGTATSSTHRVTISDGLKLISTPYNTTSFVIQTTSGTSLFNVQNDGNVGIGTITPTSKLDITGSTGYNQLRLRTSYTPTSSSDTNGNIGDVAWDDNYFYWKTSTQWLRVSGQTF